MDMPMDPAMPADGSMDMPMDHPVPETENMQMDMPADDPHAGHTMQDMAEPPAPPIGDPPPGAFSSPAHAADTVFDPAALAASREQLRRNQGGFRTQGLFVDRLEAQFGNGADGYLWDLDAWYGGDIDKFWIKSEGEGAFNGALEDAEVQALWSHAIGPFFDLQAGVRYDLRPEPDRGHLVLGVMGLAPNMFELDIASFLSDRGDLTGRIEAEYDQRITQKLILQPRVEFNLAAQDIPEIGVGAGLTSIEPGLRLRYAFVPEFAPYIGVEWQRQTGHTADFSRARGDDPDRFVFLAGVRLWF